MGGEAAVYLDEIEEREVVMPTLQRTELQYPSTAPDGSTWEDYTARAKAEGVGAVVDVPEVTTKLVSRDLSPSEEGLGRSVRGVLDRVRAAGWERVTLYSSVVSISDEFYMEDSKRKPGQEQPDHRKGELRKAAHEVTHWWLDAAHPPMRVGFKAHWTEGVTPRGGRSFLFQSAACADPIGIFVEFFVDYEPDARSLRQVKDEPAKWHQLRTTRMLATAREQDRAYNDGKSWLDRRPLFTAFKEFETWLDEALELQAKAAV